MPAPVTTDRIWKEVRARLFAVLGFVNPKGEARTSGIVYVVRNRQLYIRDWGPLANDAQA